MAEPDPITPFHGHTGESASPTVDWEYLSRQTFGDGELEKEVLTLFLQQAGDCGARLAEPARDGDGKWRGDIAHTLKGSARAIGAFGLADAAERYEAALAEGEGAEHLRELDRHLLDTRATIAARLGKN